MNMLSVKWSDGFYGFGATLVVYQGETEVRHSFENESRRTDLLSKMCQCWKGAYDSETLRYNLRSDAPQVLVNALLHDTKQTPKLPMWQRVQYLQGDVTLDNRYVIRITNKREVVSPYFGCDFGQIITDVSVCEVVDVHTGCKFREEIRINPDDRFAKRKNHERHGPYGTVVKYVWPIQDGVLRFETDRRTIHIDLSRLK